MAVAGTNNVEAARICSYNLEICTAFAPGPVVLVQEKRLKPKQGPTTLLWTGTMSREMSWQVVAKDKLSVL